MQSRGLCMLNFCTILGSYYAHFYCLSVQTRALMMLYFSASRFSLSIVERTVNESTQLKFKLAKCKRGAWRRKWSTATSNVWRKVRWNFVSSERKIEREILLTGIEQDERVRRRDSLIIIRNRISSLDAMIHFSFDVGFSLMDKSLCPASSTV